MELVVRASDLRDIMDFGTTLGDAERWEFESVGQGASDAAPNSRLTVDVYTDRDGEMVWLIVVIIVAGVAALGAMAAVTVWVLRRRGRSGGADAVADPDVQGGVAPASRGEACLAPTLGISTDHGSFTLTPTLSHQGRGSKWKPPTPVSPSRERGLKVHAVVGIWCRRRRRRVRLAGDSPSAGRPAPSAGLPSAGWPLTGTDGGSTGSL